MQNNKISEPIQKALYFHFEDIENPQKKGVINKIKGKTDAFINYQITFDFIYFKNKNELFFNESKILQVPSRILFFRNFIFKRAYKKLKNENYIFLYIRYFGSDRYFIKFLKKVKKLGIKVFLEFPTFPYDGEVRASNFIEKIIIRRDKKFRTKLHNYIFRVITFANIDEILNISTIKLKNGIDVERLPLSKTEKIKGIFNLIAVANVSRWHAFDRLIFGMKNYFQKSDSEIDVHFKIVGGGNEVKSLIELTNKLGMESKVSFVGPKMEHELDREFEGIHMAVGSLGLHRIGLFESSTLKVREYTARGLPSVIGYKDISINQEATFVIQIPSNESAVDIHELIQFYENLKVTPYEIREYAKKYLTWKIQVKKIIDLI